MTRRHRHALVEGTIQYGLVALGTGIGGILRALASLATMTLAGPGFPWGTLLVNITGSLLIGFYAAFTVPGGRIIAGTRQRLFVMTGICGGFTTFSVFSLETLHLAQSGDMPAAALNTGVSVFTWLAAVWAGYALGASLNAPIGNAGD
jgi:CrcB protein